MYLGLNTERVDMYNNRSRNSLNILVSNVSDLLTVSKLSNTLPFNCGLSDTSSNKLCMLFNIRRRRKMMGNLYVAEDNMIISCNNPLFQEYYYES